MRYACKTPRLIALMFLLFAPVLAKGQDQRLETSKHRVGAGFGFTFIPLAGELGETDAKGLFVPSLRADYFFHFSPRWAVGLMGNYELDHYMIVDQQIEREQALGISLVGKFDISEHWGVFAGAGAEIEVHRNLAVFKLGTEYSIDLGKNWALIPKLSFDFKQNYDTWSFSMSFAKAF